MKAPVHPHVTEAFRKAWAEMMKEVKDRDVLIVLQTVGRCI